MTHTNSRARRYMHEWVQANSKLQFAYSIRSVLDVLSITSAITVPLLQEAWLPFTVSMYTHVYTCIHMYTHVYLHMLYVYIFCMCVYEFVLRYHVIHNSGARARGLAAFHRHVYIQVCMYVHTSMYVCTYTDMCVHEVFILVCMCVRIQLQPLPCRCSNKHDCRVP
jgi:hypothetical protein